MARPMGARRAPSRRSYCGDKFALDWQHRHPAMLTDTITLPLRSTGIRRRLLQRAFAWLADNLGYTGGSRNAFQEIA